MVGSQVGSYKIERKLGEGGMGIVYVGIDVRLGRRAAVKQLLPEFSGQHRIVERFFNEAKAAASISHPGIVEIYDVGWHTDGSAFFAMKLLDGDCLAKRLRRTRLSPTYTAGVGRQIASALAAAHAAGIAHRDLKPDNVILVPDDEISIGDRAVVLDFGIAKLFGEQRSSSRTRTGNVLGTPTYMSPEQCRGAGKVDHRTDIYALGCMLFEMLTGRPPFVGNGAGEVIGMQQFVAPPTVRQIRRDVPEQLEAITMRCLEKDPQSRFQTMTELAAALKSFLQTSGAVPASENSGGIPFDPGADHGPPPATTLSSSRGQLTSKMSGRRRHLAPIAAASALAIAAVIVASVVASEPRSGETTLVTITPTSTPLPSPPPPQAVASIPPIDAPPPSQPGQDAPVPDASVIASSVTEQVVPAPQVAMPPRPDRERDAIDARVHHDWKRLAAIGAELKAITLVNEARSEQAAEKTLAEIQVLLETGNTVGADDALDDIPATSVYKKRAEDMLARAKNPELLELARKAISDGQRLVNEGNYTAALGEFETALANHPDRHTVTLAYLAACNSKNATKARLYYTRMTPEQQKSHRVMCIRNLIDLP